MLSLILFLAAATLVNSQHDPHFKPNRTVIVQLFEWKFNDIAKECEDFLGPRGFGGVQVSPVSENIVRKDFARPWWERYHPISYEIVSRSGTREEFEAMSRSCNDAGVRVYVDVILNHMGGPASVANEETVDDGSVESEEKEAVGTGASTANISARSYPAVPYDEKHFHRRCSIEDYTDGHQIRNCELKQLPDLDHSQEYVRKKLIGFLNELVAMGAAGFRVDAAKHIWPIALKDISARVDDLNPAYDFEEHSRPFFLEEVVDLGDHAISKTEYTGYGVVTESQHAAQIAAVFRREQPLNSLINWGPAMGFLLPPDALVFVDTHYTQRRVDGFDSVYGLNHEEPKKYTMAVAFMLAHPYGIKRIMSSFRFENNDQGPPSDEDEAITSPEFSDDDGQCPQEHRWVCEHRWNAIANMVGFANYVAAEGINSFQSPGANQVAFCRGNKGFVALNNDLEADFNGSVYACVEPGTYCDVASGSLVDGQCTGGEIIVDEERTAEVWLPADGEHGVLAIYDQSRVE